MGQFQPFGYNVSDSALYPSDSLISLAAVVGLFWLSTKIYSLVRLVASLFILPGEDVSLRIIILAYIRPDRVQNLMAHLSPFADPKVWL